MRGTETTNDPRECVLGRTFYTTKHSEELPPYREGRMPGQQTEKQREVDEIRQDASDTLRKARARRKIGFTTRQRPISKLTTMVRAQE